MKFGITRRMVFLLLLGVIVSLAGFYIGAPFLLLVIYDVLLVILYIIDFIITPGHKKLRANRIFEDGELAHEGRIALTVENLSTHNLTVRISDAPPDGLSGSITSEPVKIAPDNSFTVNYLISPSKRGRFDFGGIYVQVRGILGLAVKRAILPRKDSIKVLPNLDPMRKYRLLAEKRQLFRQDSSIHVVRGAGSDFSGLREYFSGDDYRSVNWKASARVNKLITNTYDVEKDRTVIICIDAGRSMAPNAGGFTRLDHAVESAAALAGAAISSGDRVGLVIFSNIVKTYIPPQKGKSQLKRMLDAAYDIQPDSLESDHEALCAFLSAKQRRRRLLSVFTYIDSEQEARETARIYDLCSKNNMVIIASLKSPGLAELSEAEVGSPNDVYIRAAAIYRVETQRRAAIGLSGGGIYGLLSTPAELLSEVINRYVMIKRHL